MALTVGGAAVTIDVAPNFSDRENDPLTFTVSVLSTLIATTSISGSVVTLTPVAVGLAGTTVTVTARDPAGSSVTQAFVVRVIDPARPTSVLIGTAGQCGVRAFNTITTIDTVTNKISIQWSGSVLPSLLDTITITLDGGQSQMFTTKIPSDPTVFNILPDSAGLVKFVQTHTAASGRAPCEETLQLTLPAYTPTVELESTDAIIGTAAQCGIDAFNTVTTIDPLENEIEIEWAALFVILNDISAITVTLDDGQDQMYAPILLSHTTTFNILSDSAGLVKFAATYTSGGATINCEETLQLTLP